MNVLMLVSSLDSFKKGATDGFIVDWVRVLSKKVDSLAVITYHHNPREQFNANVKIITVNGNNFLLRNLNLFQMILKYSKESDIIFAHILEIFGIFAGIIGKLLNKKSFLWYCQGYNLSNHWMAKTALFLVDKILTSTEDIKERYIKEVGKFIKNKIIVVGHGINLEHYD